MSGLIHVAAAAIVNENNEVLISRRPPDVHQGDLWEFPGGKLEVGESVQQGLAREIAEELDVHIKLCRPLIKVLHNYDDRSVLLDVWKINEYTGVPIGKEGQAIRWHSISELDNTEFPAADVPIIQALQLPEHYLITGKFASAEEFRQRLENALAGGIRLVQLRLTKDWLRDDNEKLVDDIVEIAVTACEHSKVCLMFNVPHDIQERIKPRNLHLNSRQLLSYKERPDCDLLSASCHNLDELNMAMKLKADFVLLSPVQQTASHPEIDAMGWEQFASLANCINVPVYALGGMTKVDTETAWLYGGQGVAAIGAFWND